MTSTTGMTYKGYAARVGYDAMDEIFVGRLVGIGDVVGFHSDTVAGLKSAFHEAVDDYLTACARVGKAAEQPHSGDMVLRIAPEIHAKATLAARLSGKTVDRWGEDVLSAAASAAVCD